jgi:pseudaminic acid synthase
MIHTKIEKLFKGTSETIIVAELSANHNHDLDLAIETIKAAKRSGADAIKTQTYTADTMTIDSNRDEFVIQQGTLWDGMTLYELYKKAYTPWDWQPILKEVAEKEGLIFFSTPFDNSSVDFLESINVELYKIASFEIQDIPLIEYVASKGKPIILSTGIASLADIEEAVKASRRMGNNRIALLKCTSSYPAPIEEANLKTMINMKDTFNTIVGLSDHTMGGDIASVATALGAKIIEKHFILDRKIGGPDASFSMEPKEFHEMVRKIRITERAIGNVSYELSEKVFKNKVFARSIFVVEDIKKGEKFTSKNTRTIRPGFGMHPKHFKAILAKEATMNIKKGKPLMWHMVSV